MNQVSAYRSKFFQFRGVWEIDDTRLKFYTIGSGANTEFTDGLIGSARDYAAESLPRAKALEGSDHNLGYVILHPGQMAKWLLIHWWANQDIALAMLASAAPGADSIQFFSQDHRHFHACVWEHVVINHERDAWVKHMMRDQSDPGSYLADCLADGEY